jgi:hypothetical protein
LARRNRAGHLVRSPDHVRGGIQSLSVFFNVVHHHQHPIVVDRHFKTEIVEEGAAKKAAAELLAEYPMLRIEIYNASSRSRTLLK